MITYGSKSKIGAVTVFNIGHNTAGAIREYPIDLLRPPVFRRSIEVCLLYKRLCIILYGSLRPGLVDVVAAA